MRYNFLCLVFLLAFHSCTQKKDVGETAIIDSAENSKITPEMARDMKATMKKKLTGTEFEKAYNVDQMCECEINAIGKEFTIKEMKQKDFKKTEKYKRITDDCLEMSKKEK